MAHHSQDLLYEAEATRPALNRLAWARRAEHIASSSRVPFIKFARVIGPWDQSDRMVNILKK